MTDLDLTSHPIAVIGLGYVGLPLAVAFARRQKVVGFDLDARRVAALAAGHDATGEVEDADLAAATNLTITADPAALTGCRTFVVAVPTPVDDAKTPDLSRLLAASETVGKAMGPGAVVVYESTVFPGCTREICVPALERASGLTRGRDFAFGYSPERVNPGDKARRLEAIVKVTSGSSAEAAAAIDALYASVVTAGTHRAPSIEVAEAAKIIENTQRDLNIALMNELAMLFHRLGLDTQEVLDAAATKWNFLRFAPGLVGGHCIGVDPYYLTHRAQQVGHHPEIILAGRRINDAMGAHVVDRVMRLMMRRGMPVVGSKVLVMGLTFKENCPDLRNSRVVDVVSEFAELSAEVEVWDPHVDPDEAERMYGVRPLPAAPQPGGYDAVVLAVPHADFVRLGAGAIRGFGRANAVFFDVKSAFAREESDGRL
ncbi:nucleotide sugar dehydrogenase [Acuticoccus mangrovi]|uniref:nucleotide sugar dehydrogenase n=1 Tax=Acuticoccus mangrovi TaxID=2796142 RepID=UPI001B3BE43A|nr:nucleotide sugar dehydrogenase [Acuticoccus mangrovi]